jgi:transposase
MGIHCDVVAPTLVPVKSGDRVKTDRRDALKLARCYRSGDLTAVWVPDAKHEALRDLVRAREAAKADQLRARHRLGKFLLRQGRRAPIGVKPWSGRHSEWLLSMTFSEDAHQATFLDYRHEVDHASDRINRLDTALDVAIDKAPEHLRAVIAALQGLRGVRKITAVTLVAEIGKFSRFDHPRQLMGYSGAVPSEFSTGGPGKARRGAITKTGNSRLRRVVVEAAWNYRFLPARSAPLRKRQQGLSEEIKQISWKAQHRLYDRYRRLSGRGLPPQKMITAIGRELIGFIWDVGIRAERAWQSSHTKVAAAA